MKYQVGYWKEHIELIDAFFIQAEEYIKCQSLI